MEAEDQSHWTKVLIEEDEALGKLAQKGGVPQ